MKRFRLDGKTAIVTGASRGLGRRVAEDLAEAGANLLLVSRGADEVNAAAAEIARTHGVKCAAVAGDVVNPVTSAQCVDRACRELGGLHILVNNAGINVRGAIEQVTPEDFDRVMAVNVKGPWLLCRAAAPILKRQQWGRVINLASALGLVAIADRSLYCTSKGAVVQLTRELAVEWAASGVTVNAVCPGPFETEMNLVLTQDPAVKQAFAAHTAMKRWGRMEEIGGVMVFLASEAAGYVTGAMIPVDGGWTAQ